VPVALAVLAAALTVSACAGKRIVEGVYHSPKGYRVAIPGADWKVLDGSRADLELRHATSSAGILVNASCDPAAVRRPLGLLQRQLLAGLRDREVKEQEIVSLDGREAAHARLAGRLDGDAERVEIEAYVVKGGRCVYDLLYAAPPAEAPAGRDDFRRLVDSLVAE
jgi:hypothetical protein